MATTYSLSRLCTDFFSPLRPAAQVPPRAQTREPCDVIAAHFTTLNGAWDLFRIIEYTVSFFKYLPLNTAQKEFSDQVANVMNKAGIALSVPRVITGVYNLKHSFRQITNAHETPAVDDERGKIIAHAYKHGLINMMNCVNDMTQAAMFLSDVAIVNLGKHYCVAEFFYDFSSLFNDTTELVGEVFKLHHYNSMPGPDNLVAARELQEKRNLSWMKVAKDAPSIVGSVIAIAAIFFVSLQAPVIATISLGLSAMWLMMKLTSFFYEKIIVERHRLRV